MRDAVSHPPTEQGESDEVKCEKREDRNKTKRHNPQNTQTHRRLEKAVTDRDLPVTDSLLVCQQLVDVPAVRPKETLAVTKPDVGDRQLIRVKGKKKGT